VNIGMSGDLKGLDFEDGEDVEFELAHFDSSDDINVQTLVQLYKQIEAAKQKLINLNGVKEEELEVVLPE
jgi:hypothetical protein